MVRTKPSFPFWAYVDLICFSLFLRLLQFPTHLLLAMYFIYILYSFHLNIIRRNTFHNQQCSIIVANKQVKQNKHNIKRPFIYFNYGSLKPHKANMMISHILNRRRSESFRSQTRRTHPRRRSAPAPPSAASCPSRWSSRAAASLAPSPARPPPGL